MTKEALMYCCQSAPGAGHIQRALALAGELSEHFEVTLVLSKRPAETVAAPDGVKLVFLGALEADPESNLKQRSSARRDTILRIFDSLRPRVLAIDSFPFPGYPLHEDFLALVKEARSDHHGESLVACVTDGILANDAPNNEALANRAADILDRYFDIVIVRSDPIFARLEEFFRPKNNVRTPLYHTGFIAPERSDLRPSAGRSRNGIVVSAGAGVSGMALYKCAIEAHRTLRHILPIPMTIIAGRRLSEDNWQALQSLADGQPALSLRRTSPTLAA
ncbi:MAG: hypothetical protein E4H01_15200 [Lysobacterales bacterium]|nr:MAG: hypothetical protein E4H01_15200 [Xanthomonadales bacterium]